MKLYRINYTSRDDGKDYCAWVGTQADAKAKHKHLCELHERFNVDKPVQVDFPTDKPGLLKWLNGEKWEHL